MQKLNIELGEGNSKKPFRLNLPLAWLANIVVSLAFGYGLYIEGVNGDCKPHEIDGQCGMSSFFGFVAGVLIGLVLFCVFAVYLTILAYKRRKILQEGADNK